MPATDGRTLPVVNPSTEEVICRVAAASEVDVQLAVAAAKRAFEREGQVSNHFSSLIFPLLLSLSFSLWWLASLLAERLLGPFAVPEAGRRS